jgi:hypothetical protein
VVFRTIKENLHSFFQKEEELERNPRKLPDAAIEVFEKPSTTQPQHHTIVTRSMKGVAPPKEPERKPLPFSADQLRQRLAQQTQAPEQRPKSADAEKEIETQILAFEQAIRGMPGEDGSTLPLSGVAPTPQIPVLASSPAQRDLFFTEFANQLKERGYDVDEETLTRLLDGMRSHHERRIAVERHRGKVEDLETALTRKLSELQGLEHDWATKRQEITTASERTRELESEIAERTAELKTLVASIRVQVAAGPASAAPFFKEGEVPNQEEIPPPFVVGSSAVATMPISADTAPAQVSSPNETGHPFHLSGGRVLRSLSQLREALLVMDDTVFYHHVTPGRNDFADWIQHAFIDPALAEKVRQARNRYELARILEHR